MTLRLSDIAAVLGCDKGTASRLRSGTYDRPSSGLIERYAALVRVAEAARRAAALDPAAICRACPRESCDGCRVAEI